MATPLRGETAFITGAGSGSGQLTAYALARRGVRQLALCDINASSLSQTTTQLETNDATLEILPIEMDTSEEDFVHSAIQKTVSAFSRIDYAINSAGIGTRSPFPTHETLLTDWQKVVNVNLTGVWLCQRAQITQMLTQEPLFQAREEVVA